MASDASLRRPLSTSGLVIRLVVGTPTIAYLLLVLALAATPAAVEHDAARLATLGTPWFAYVYAKRNARSTQRSIAWAAFSLAILCLMGVVVILAIGWLLGGLADMN